MPRSLLTLISPLAAALVVVWSLACLAIACRPPSSAPPAAPAALESAAQEVLLAARPALRQMADSAVVAVGTTSLSASGEVGLVLDLLVRAAHEYEQLVAARQWSDRLVPILREALAAYERLRDLGVPLPPVPQIVRDLLRPCDTVAAPGGLTLVEPWQGVAERPELSRRGGPLPGIPSGAVAFSAACARSGRAVAS